MWVVERLHAAASQLIDDALIATGLRSLWTEAEDHGASSAFFDHGVGLILHRLAQMRAKQSEARAYSGLSSRQLNLVLEMIEDQLGGDLSVTDMTAMVGRDVRGFTRSFRASTGRAPYEYLTYRRMEKAKELLKGPQNITQIAGSLSYANPAKFASAFKKYTDLSPTAWRKNVISSN